MARLGEKDILHVAKLAKLQLTEEQISRFTKELAKVIDYINQLQEVNVKGVQPTSQTTGLTNIARKDTINSTRILNKKDATSEAKNVKNGYFVVPMLLEERTDK